MLRFSSRLLTLLFCVLLSACNQIWQKHEAPAEMHYLRRALANAGVVRVSPDNPFVDPNRLLSFEAENSPELQGFLKHRGQPNALELADSGTRPAKLRLYYRDGMEMFQLREIEKQWSIRGPYQITSPTTRELLGASRRNTSDSDSSALLAEKSSPPAAILPPVSSRSETANEARISDEGENQDLEALLENGTEPQAASPQQAPTPALEAEEDERSNTAAVQSPETEKSVTPFPDSDTPLQGSLPPSSPPLKKKTLGALERETPSTLPAAARTEAVQKTLEENSGDSSEEPQDPDTDVEHTVRYSGETLRLISKWYTGTAENADRIARINKLKNPNRLRLKQVIRIPEYLLVRLEPFPKSEVYRYLGR